jgi:predicted nucleotidyltransferase
MLAERPLPEDLADRIDALCQTWSSDPDLAAIYLFGSRAGGRGGPRSDVDLAVVLREELEWIESTEAFAAAINHCLEQNVDH